MWDIGTKTWGERKLKFPARHPNIPVNEFIPYAVLNVGLFPKNRKKKKKAKTSNNVFQNSNLFKASTNINAHIKNKRLFHRNFTVIYRKSSDQIM